MATAQVGNFEALKTKDSNDGNYEISVKIRADLGGNQREKAREKNMKKAQSDKKKADNKSTSLELRKQRDAEIMRQKQLAKDQAQEGGACGGK